MIHPGSSGIHRPSISLPRPLAFLVGAVFLLVLTVPTLALLAGARPLNIEERRLAAMPSLSPEALLTTPFYADVDRALVDHFPLREAAAATFGHVIYDILGASPSKQVVVGADGWLFFRGEVRPVCRFGAAGLAGQIGAIQSELAPAGRRVVLAVVPDKHGILPETLGPAAVLGRPCTDHHRASFRKLAAADDSAIVDLWTPLLAAHAAEPDTALYFQRDSHWTPAGAVVAIQQIVDALEPGVWDPTEVRAEGLETRGDELSRLMGLIRSEDAEQYRVDREGHVEGTVLDEASTRGGDPVDAYTVLGSGPVVPGTTVILYDSFFNIRRSLIIPWFEHSIWIRTTDLHGHPDLARFAAGYDTLLFEIVERQAYATSPRELLLPITSLP